MQQRFRKVDWIGFLGQVFCFFAGQSTWQEILLFGNTLLKGKATNERGLDQLNQSFQEVPLSRAVHLQQNHKTWCCRPNRSNWKRITHYRPHRPPMERHKFERVRERMKAKAVTRIVGTN